MDPKPNPDNQPVIDQNRQLLEEQARLTASINSLSVGFVMITSDYQVQALNSTAQRIFDLGPELDVSLMHLLERKLIPVINLRRLVEKVMSQRLVEIKDLSFNGRYYRFFINPIVLPGSREVIGAVLMIEDITEAKILERSKDEFFAIASHELRTPLTAIRGFAYLIKRYYANKIEDPKFMNMLNRVEESSLRLIHIVNEFLDTSRIEQNRASIKKLTVNLDLLIRDIVNEYRPSAEAKGLSLIYQPSPKELLVHADPERVKQVLINLISNSLKFTHAGSITITTQIEQQFLKVLVTDTGIGILEANQGLLFRKFQQAGRSPFVRDATGTGLGLYIAKLLVNQMGGTIKLEHSSPEHGSTFSFTLPQDQVL